MASIKELESQRQRLIKIKAQEERKLKLKKEIFALKNRKLLGPARFVGRGVKKGALGLYNYAQKVDMNNPRITKKKKFKTPSDYGFYDGSVL